MGARPGGNGTSTSSAVESPCDARVPEYQGIWFEDLQCLQTTWPQAVEPDPEQSLTPVKSESFAWCLVCHGQLLAKRQDFEVQEGAASE